MPWVVFELLSIINVSTPEKPLKKAYSWKYANVVSFWTISPYGERGYLFWLLRYYGGSNTLHLSMNIVYFSKHLFLYFLGGFKIFNELGVDPNSLKIKKHNSTFLYRVIKWNWNKVWLNSTVSKSNWYQIYEGKVFVCIFIILFPTYPSFWRPLAKGCFSSFLLQVISNWNPYENFQNILENPEHSRNFLGKWTF